MSGIAIFNTAVRQLQNSQKNLMAISEARKKLEQDQEMFGLKKKKAELDLEMAVKEGRMTDLQADVLQAQHKTYLQQEQDKMKGKIASVKVAQQENASVADKAMQWAKIAYKSDPQGVTGFLQAMKRNDERTQEIRPKMSYGKIGYETVDVSAEEAEAQDAASIRESRELDIKKKKKDLEAGVDEGYSSQEISVAKEIANNDPDYDTPFESKLKKALPKAREALGGKGQIKDEEQGGSQNTKQFRNKKTGKVETFKMDGAGKWVKI